MNTLERNNRAISNWLLVCLLLIFAMVILGGVTRLTGSGLSMVNWHPIHGVVPPINATEWAEEFANYQQSPEFQKINSHMSVDDFKGIFYFEYTHRMLGRLIGLVFLLPFLYFWLTKKIAPGLTPKLLVLFVLGGLQGLLGWYMVKSGLVSNPHVSQYRLTAHLGAAVLIYGAMLWMILSLRRPQDAPARSSISGRHLAALGLLILIIVTIMSGGFVAGLKAGLIFNTFPKMGDSWVPDGLLSLSPWYMNWFENLVAVQFNHRILALSTAAMALLYVFLGRNSDDSAFLKRSFALLALMVVVQVTLGISTLLLQVPVWLGATHQGGALLLFTAILVNIHGLYRPRV